MDDVWSRGAWDDVNICFPDDRNTSRVLLTARLEGVANDVSSNNNFSHQMHLLDEDESWNLFREKVLINCTCYIGEFETIARPIVEKCRGLPLAIIMAAGLFSKLKTLDEWENIVKALNSSSTTTISEACSRILSLSYNDLPCNLKACFLYLGVFPEDEEIDANNLARLWAAEGFVKTTSQNESYEAVAERYIQELNYRNLIIKSQSSSNGRKIKRFRVHDILHAFCVKEAENDNLLHIVSKSNPNFPQKGCRWISIQWSNFDILKFFFQKFSFYPLFFQGTTLEFAKFQCIESVPHNSILQLIFFKFDELDLEYWEATNDHFPELESLVLHNCDLKEIPDSFADISTLKLIELRRYLPSVVILAKKIQEDQHDHGNDEMVVIEK